MTLIYERNIDILKMYTCTPKMKSVCQKFQKFQKLKDEQYRHVDRGD